MVPMMSAMRRELVWMSSIVSTTWATMLPPCDATSAAEAASGLAILVTLFRNRRTIDVSDIDSLKG